MLNNVLTRRIYIEVDTFFKPDGTSSCGNGKRKSEMRDLKVNELSHVYGAGGKGKGCYSSCGNGSNRHGSGSKKHGSGSKKHGSGSKRHRNGSKKGSRCW